MCRATACDAESADHATKGRVAKNWLRAGFEPATMWPKSHCFATAPPRLYMKRRFFKPSTSRKKSIFSLNQGQECVFKLRKCAQSIPCINLSLEEVFQLIKRQGTHFTYFHYIKLWKNNTFFIGDFFIEKSIFDAVFFHYMVFSIVDFIFKTIPIRKSHWKADFWKPVAVPTYT